MPRVIFLFLSQMIFNSYAFAASVDLLFCIESALTNSAEIRRLESILMLSRKWKSKV